MNRYYLILPLFALLSAGGFSLIRQKEIAGSREKEGRMDGRVSGLQSVGEDSLMEIGDTKHRIRPDHPEQTVEETEELLRTTIIPVVDFPEDQLYSERIESLNELIEQVGVEPHRLRVVMPTTDPFREFRYRCDHALTLENAPVVVILRYILDSTKLRAQVKRGGVVEVADGTFPNYEVLPEVAAPETTEPRTGEVDIFGNPVNEFGNPVDEGLDPFPD